MAARLPGTQVGDLSPRFSQYLAARGAKPLSTESWHWVKPASTRAARSWRPETILDSKIAMDLRIVVGHVSTNDVARIRIIDRDSARQANTAFGLMKKNRASAWLDQMM